MDFNKLYRVVFVILILIVLAGIALLRTVESDTMKAVIVIVAAIVANSIWMAFLFYQSRLKRQGRINDEWKSF